MQTLMENFVMHQVGARVNVKEVHSQAKVIGTLVTFGGALLMTLYKGPQINLFYSPNTTHQQDGVHSPQGLKHWVSGTLFLLLGCVAWSSFIILQVVYCVLLNLILVSLVKVCIN